MNQRLTNWDSFCFKVAIIRALRRYGCTNVRALNHNNEFPEEYKGRLSGFLERMADAKLVRQYGTPKAYKYSNIKGNLEDLAQTENYAVTSIPKPGREFDAMTNYAPHKAPKVKVNGSRPAQDRLFPDDSDAATKSQVRTKTHGVDVESLSATQRAALLKDLSNYIK